MTTAIESQYHFTAEVKSKGKQQNRDGWAMVVDWKLPGSKFDLTLYGQDWETVQGFEVGETAIITINQGNLKANKDGRYSTDYFWDMVSIEPTWIAEDGERVASDEAPPVQAPPKPNPAPAPPARTPAPNMEPPPNPAALGQCQNHANDAIMYEIWPVPEGRDYTSWLLECRDWIYRNVNQAPVAPLHYCYQHDQERRQSKTGNWGHILPKQGDDEEDAYCVENREGWRVFDASQR